MGCQRLCARWGGGGRTSLGRIAAIYIQSTSFSWRLVNVATAGRNHDPGWNDYHKFEEQ